MEVHARAPLSPIGRQRVVDRVMCDGWSVTAAAEAAGVTERTVYRWLARWRADGPGGGGGRRRHRAHGLPVAGAVAGRRPGGARRPSFGARPYPAQDAGRPGRRDL